LKKETRGRCQIGLAFLQNAYTVLVSVHMEQVFKHMESTGPAMG